jgi:hypothetical protein
MLTLASTPTSPAETGVAARASAAIARPRNGEGGGETAIPPSATSRISTNRTRKALARASALSRADRTASVRAAARAAPSLRKPKSTPSRLLAPELRPASMTGPTLARSSTRTVTVLEA